MTLPVPEVLAIPDIDAVDRPHEAQELAEPDDNNEGSGALMNKKKKTGFSISKFANRIFKKVFTLT